MKQGIKILLFLFLFLGLGYSCLLIWNAESLETVNLGTLSNDETEMNFICPYGHNFDLIVGIHTNQNQRFANRISGTITIKCGTNESQFRFHAHASAECNWLKGDVDEAYLITWPTGKEPIYLDGTLSAGQQTIIGVHLADVSLSTNSLWLAYLSSVSDRWK